MIWSLLYWQNDSNSVQDDSLSAACHAWHSPLNIGQNALILLLLRPHAHQQRGARWTHPQGPAAWFSSHRGENKQSVEQMCWEDSLDSSARSWWPGLVLGSWERGKRSRGKRQSTQQLTPPLIAISSYSHKPKVSDFSAGRPHVHSFIWNLISHTTTFYREKAVCCGEKPRMSPLSSFTLQYQYYNHLKIVNIPISQIICFNYQQN